MHPAWGDYTAARPLCHAGFMRRQEAGQSVYLSLFSIKPAVLICCRSGARQRWRKCGSLISRLKLTVNETKTCTVPSPAG